MLPRLEPRAGLTAGRRGTLALLVSFAAGASPARAADAVYLVEAASGFAVPLDDRHRDVYGNAALFSVAGAHRPGASDTWVFAEVGLAHASGFTYDRDPTFLFGDTQQWLLPITFGIRTALSTPDRVRGRVYAGIGLCAALAWRDDPLRGTETGSAYGIVLELRHDLAVADRFGLFVQPRLVLLSPVDYGRIQDTEHSNLRIEFGTSFGRAAGTARRY